MIKIDEIQVGDFIFCVESYYVMVDTMKSRKHKSNVIISNDIESKQSKKEIEEIIKKERLEQFNSNLKNKIYNRADLKSNKDLYMEYDIIYTSDYPKLYKESFSNIGSHKIFDPRKFKLKILEEDLAKTQIKQFYFKKGKSYKVLKKLFNSEILVESEIKFNVAIIRSGFESFSHTTVDENEVSNIFIDKKEKRKIALQTLSNNNFENFLKELKSKKSS